LDFPIPPEQVGLSTGGDGIPATEQNSIIFGMKSNTEIMLAR